MRLATLNVSFREMPKDLNKVHDATRAVGTQDQSLQEAGWTSEVCPDEGFADGPS